MTPLKKLEHMAQLCLRRQEAAQFDHYVQYWASRCVLELEYAWKLSESEGGAYDELVNGAIEAAWQAFLREGTLTRADTEAVECVLEPIAAKAKGYAFLCVGHAHLDMNWMWGYEETVGITLDTFHTMLELMKEYPEFTLGQSQASVYRMVEKHAPEMLDEIRQRVHEGRWEVTASTWVEADRNMPNLESMARHFLYTRQYLSKLLDISPDSLNIDYEPDTFGHGAHVPEVLSDAGVKYYYHWRGRNGSVLYNWRAPSGREVLVYCDPLSYNWTVDGSCALQLPGFCKKHGLNVQIRPYGVGDHGGGPTRRDIEKIIDMNSWPIFPAYRFGTYREFYRAAEAKRANFETVEGALNFVFDGCYTTQTREKRRNRLGEAALSEAEGICALSRRITGLSYDRAGFTEAWERVLFNQFHDILPGSGTVDSREYAMGQYQEAFAVANVNHRRALRALSEATDTSALAGREDIRLTRSEGAGAGFGGLSDGVIAPLGNHAGIRRLFTVYNPLPFPREEIIRITVWDWTGNAQNMRWTDADGRVLEHQLAAHGRSEHYWGHMHTDALVKVAVPAMGYTTVALDDPGPETISDHTSWGWERVQKPPVRVLENDCLRVELDPRDGTIVSMRNKESGVEYVPEGKPMGVFRLVEEDLDPNNMSAWRVGAYRKVERVNRGVSFVEADCVPGALRQTLAYEVSFGNRSKLRVAMSLDRGEHMLRMDVDVRWQEIGDETSAHPQLNFLMPVNYAYTSVRCDGPMGAQDRELMDMDQPVHAYAMPVNAGGESLMLINDSKYGYRCTQEGLSLTLIRSSVYPDPWPEVGAHHIRMAIAPSVGDRSKEALLARSFCRGFSICAAQAHSGQLPPSQSLLTFANEGLTLSCVKQSEDSEGLVVRFFEHLGRDGRGTVKLWRQIKSAQLVDLLERPLEGEVEIRGDEATFTYRANRIGGLKIAVR